MDLGHYRYFCATAVGVGVIYCKSSNVNMAWKSSTDDFDISQFMAEPVTDLTYLKENKSDMKIKVELLILRIQVSNCSASFQNLSKEKRKKSFQERQKTVFLQDDW